MYTDTSVRVNTDRYIVLLPSVLEVLIQLKFVLKHHIASKMICYAACLWPFLRVVVPLLFKSFNLQNVNEKVFFIVCYDWWKHFQKKHWCFYRNKVYLLYRIMYLIMTDVDLSRYLMYSEKVHCYIPTIYKPVKNNNPTSFSSNTKTK